MYINFIAFEIVIFSYYCSMIKKQYYIKLYCFLLMKFLSSTDLLSCVCVCVCVCELYTKLLAVISK